MRGFEIVTIVIAVFFVIGIAVGMLLVIVLPLLRSLLWARRQRRWYADDVNWRGMPPRDARRPSRWPGG